MRFPHECYRCFFPIRPGAVPETFVGKDGKNYFLPPSECSCVDWFCPNCNQWTRPASIVDVRDRHKIPGDVEIVFDPI